MSDTTQVEPAETRDTAYEPQVLALICERSVPIAELVDAESRLRDASNVFVLRFPCSGMIKPALAQLALEEGWDGVLVVGCAVGDCHFREGNLFARERFRGDRAPNKFRRMDQRRVALLWRAIPEGDRFLETVREFNAQLVELGPNVRNDDGKAARRR
ncbi:MAG: hydrogenase iron-sulfur subunit [Armatimonadetes bacterium]|nr:hydrogenase iron-sulfur subunit [Armatimonadota bacterium]